MKQRLVAVHLPCKVVVAADNASIALPIQKYCLQQQTDFTDKASQTRSPFEFRDTK